jgi:hypothetical protein
MLTVQGPPRRLCDGLQRRDFLRAGALATFGLSLGDLLRAKAAAQAAPIGFGRARRCILLFLTGGPPQLDTWDLKPQAPAEVRGELRPIATRVPGIEISELFPRLAGQADKYTIVRSVTHADTVHTSAGYTMLTGAYHPAPNETTAENIRPSPDDHPHLGCILGFERARRRGLPAFVSMPEIIRDAGVNTFPGQDAGFLGKQHGPFLIESDEHRQSLRPPQIVLPADLSTQRLIDRRSLLSAMNSASTLTAVEQVAQVDGYYAQAFDLIGSAAAGLAFEVDREPAAVRDAYGAHLFGKGCLLARRLIEAGVALVTVYWHYEGPDDSPVWDTHESNFPHLRERLMPPTDQAVSSLLADLHDRGLLDDTLVVCMGEFGRSPKINRLGGREHWPQLQSVMMAGAGIAKGAIYGASDRHGAYPADRPVAPPDLAATILHLLGVPPDLMLRDRQGRPIAACQGTPIADLLA